MLTISTNSISRPDIFISYKIVIEIFCRRILKSYLLYKIQWGKNIAQHINICNFIVILQDSAYSTRCRNVTTTTTTGKGYNSFFSNFKLLFFLENTLNIGFWTLTPGK